METTGLILRKPRLASKIQVYLLLSSSPPTGHDRGIFSSRWFSKASPSFTISRRWLAANLLVVLCHFGALSCHFLLPYSWPQSTGRIYRKVIIMGSLLEKLVVQLVPRQGWRMAEARHLLDRAEIRYNTLSGPGQNVG